MTDLSHCSFIIDRWGDSWREMLHAFIFCLPCTPPPAGCILQSVRRAQKMFCLLRSFSCQTYLIDSTLLGCNFVAGRHFNHRNWAKMHTIRLEVGVYIGCIVENSDSPMIFVAKNHKSHMLCLNVLLWAHHISLQSSPLIPKMNAPWCSCEIQDKTGLLQLWDLDGRSKCRGQYMPWWIVEWIYIDYWGMDVGLDIDKQTG